MCVLHDPTNFFFFLILVPSNISDDDIHSVEQIILQVPQELKVHSHIHNSLVMSLILSQINPVHNSKSDFFTNHFNIIFLSTPLRLRFFVPFHV